MIKKKIVAGALSLALLASAFTTVPAQKAKAATISGTITLSGSTSVSPLAQQLAKQFVKKYPKVKINFTNITGSGSGIADATNGKVDIGMSSRALKDTEKSVLTENVICNDGIAIVVNKSNPSTNITPSQLYNIYAKKTTNWSSINSKFSQKVAAYGRESGSGTRSCFEDVLKNDFGLKMSSNYGSLDAVISTTGAMQTSVRTNKGAIGYMSLGDLDTKQVKALRFNGVSATTANVANGKYKMSRPFVLATKGAPNTQTKTFINWCKTNTTAQSVVAKMGFVKLSVTKVSPRSVKFSKKTITLKKGKKKTLKYTVYPAIAKNKAVTFKSSKKKVATVSKKGVVKAKKKGTTTITIKTVDGKKTAKCKIKVK